MSTYTLTVKNDSTNAVDMAIFQEAPDLGTGINVFTLAWFSKYTYQQTIAVFTWGIDYSAIWSRPGQKLRPGVVCNTSQHVPVDLAAENTTTLTYDAPNNAFNFGPLSKGSVGSIFTNCDNSVPNSNTTPSAAAGIGIAVSGAGTFLVDTQPNQNTTWTPKPKYYLVAGTFKQGEILDVQQIMNAGRALEIPYKGILSQTATLNQNNQLVLG
jgi:hypothetical protein